MTTTPIPAGASSFAQWCDANPPPDLHELVRTWGNYWAIPEEAWRDYQKAMERWQLARRDRFLR